MSERAVNTAPAIRRNRKFLESKIVAKSLRLRASPDRQRRILVSRATPFKATGHKDGISRQELTLLRGCFEMNGLGMGAANGLPSFKG